MINKIVLVTVVLSICLCNHASSAENEGKETCEEQLKVIDRIGRMILLMTKDRIVPKEPAIHKEWCKLTLTLTKKFAQYGKCEKLFPAQVLAIFSSSIRKPVRYVCIEEKSKFMEHYDCMTPEFFDRVNQGERYLLNSLKYMALNATSNDVLPLFCCTFMDFFHFLQNELLPLTCKRGDINPAKFYQIRVQTAMADMVHLICGGYKDRKACETKAPNQVKLIRSEPPADLDFYGQPVMKYVLEAVTKMS